MFKLIVITSESPLPDEAIRINDLFEEGLERLHLRKPGWSESAVEKLLKEIDDQYYKKIVVHYHQGIAKKFKLGGLHLKANDFKGFNKEYEGFLSCGVHSWQEFKSIESKIDYAFVSPFFNSISKESYKGNEQLLKIPEDINIAKAIALGGIQKSNVKQVKQMNLGGAAVIGAVWNGQDPIKAYKELKMMIS